MEWKLASQGGEETAGITSLSRWMHFLRCRIRGVDCKLESWMPKRRNILRHVAVQERDDVLFN